MKTGYLVWDANAQRPDIRYHSGAYYGGLHCGNVLEALIQDKWKPMRLEYRSGTDSWYLAGIENKDDILWLVVRN